MVGVLALQGDFAEHMHILESVQVDSLHVRTKEDLDRVYALIIPGGESTVMMKLLIASGLDKEIIVRVQGGMPVFGTCAGAILLSKSHLNLIDIDVDRNAYGSQVQSFRANIDIKNIGSVEGEFIRAPKITTVGSGVDVLAENEGSAVLVQQGSVLAATFHTETVAVNLLHAYFLSLMTL